MAEVPVPSRPVHAMLGSSKAAPKEDVVSEGHRAGEEEVVGEGGGKREEGQEDTGTGTQGERGQANAVTGDRDDDAQQEGGAASSEQTVPVMYIRVANPDGGFFFFDTATQQLYEGDGEPPADQILKEPKLDSPLRLPPREGGF